MCFIEFRQQIDAPPGTARAGETAQTLLGRGDAGLPQVDGDGRHFPAGTVREERIAFPAENGSIAAEFPAGGGVTGFRCGKGGSAAGEVDAIGRIGRDHCVIGHLAEFAE